MQEISTHENIVKAMGTIKAVHKIVELGIIPSDETMKEFSKGMAILDNYVWEKIADEIIEGK